MSPPSYREALRKLRRMLENAEPTHCVIPCEACGNLILCESKIEHVNWHRKRSSRVAWLSSPNEQVIFWRGLSGVTGWIGIPTTDAARCPVLASPEAVCAAEWVRKHAPLLRRAGIGVRRRDLVYLLPLQTWEFILSLARNSPTPETFTGDCHAIFTEAARLAHHADRPHRQGPAGEDARGGEALPAL